MSNQEVQRAVREAADRLNVMLEALAKQFTADRNSGVSQQIADAQAQLLAATRSVARVAPAPELARTPQGRVSVGSAPDEASHGVSARF